MRRCARIWAKRAPNCCRSVASQFYPDEYVGKCIRTFERGLIFPGKVKPVALEERNGVPVGKICDDLLERGVIDIGLSELPQMPQHEIQQSSMRLIAI
jgi:hypothetical protein